MGNHIKFFRDYAEHNCFISSLQTAVVYCSCNICSTSIQAHSFKLIDDFLIFLAENIRNPLLSCWNMHLKKKKKDSVSLRLLFSLHHCWAKLLSSTSTQQTNVLTCTLAKYIHTHESEPRFLTQLYKEPIYETQGIISGPHHQLMQYIILTRGDRVHQQWLITQQTPWSYMRTRHYCAAGSHKLREHEWIGLEHPAHLVQTTLLCVHAFVCVGYV